MVYDLTFKEAIDVLQNKIGLVQGENFVKMSICLLIESKMILLKMWQMIHAWACGIGTAI